MRDGARTRAGTLCTAMSGNRKMDFLERVDPGETSGGKNCRLPETLMVGSAGFEPATYRV
jgi:hypothetical protein